MKTIRLSEKQASELRNACDTRGDSIYDDPESGDDFENTPGALDALRSKLKAGTVELTDEEAAWCFGEAENQADMAAANLRHDPEYFGTLRSMETLCEKLK